MVINQKSSHYDLRTLIGPTTSSKPSPRFPSRTKPFCKTSTLPRILITANILLISGIQSRHEETPAASNSWILSDRATSEGQIVFGGSRDANNRSRCGWRISLKNCVDVLGSGSIVASHKASYEIERQLGTEFNRSEGERCLMTMLPLFSGAPLAAFGLVYTSASPPLQHKHSLTFAFDSILKR